MPRRTARPPAVARTAGLHCSVQRVAGLAIVSAGALISAAHLLQAAVAA